MRSGAWVPAAAAAGACGALASALSKLAIGGDMAELSGEGNVSTDALGTGHWHGLGETQQRLLVGAMVVAANVAMWLLFSKALAASPSAASASAVNTTSNIMITVFFRYFWGHTCKRILLEPGPLNNAHTQGLLGALVFAEPLTLRFYLGLCFLAAGSILL